MTNPENYIKVIKGDITKIKVDAIVNAANTHLAGGGGVDGTIHKAGGKTILEECREIIKRDGCCIPGNAVITNAGDLPAKYVIHAVGPVWQGGNSGEKTLLESAYLSSLRIAEKHGLKSVSFPNISTGVYSFPKEQAAAIAINTVKRFLENLDFEMNIIFVCFDDLNYSLYIRMLELMD